MTMPPRVAQLPTHRGFPIPWNVVIGKDGAPLFRVNDDRKRLKALQQALCPICGERLGKWKWFTGGPRSAYDPNGWYYDLPMHHDCCEYSLSTCPYLAARHYLRELHVEAEASKMPTGHAMLVDHTQLPDRPELFVAVASQLVEIGEAEVFMERYLKQPYVRPARPYLAQEFWQQGVRLTEEQALPLLRRALGDTWNLPKLAE